MNRSPGIGADQGADTTLHEQVAGHRRFAVNRNRIAVRGCHREGHLHPVAAQAIRQAGHQVAGTIFALTIQYRFQGIYPFRGFDRIEIFSCLQTHRGLSE